MIRRLPRSTLTDTLFPYTTLFRSPVRLDSKPPVRPEEPLSPVEMASRRTICRVWSFETGLRQAQPLLRTNGRLCNPLEPDRLQGVSGLDASHAAPIRSEERRVGKECVDKCRYWRSL